MSGGSMDTNDRLIEALRWENDFWTQAVHKTERRDSMLLYIGIVIGIREAQKIMERLGDSDAAN